MHHCSLFSPVRPAQPGNPSGRESFHDRSMSSPFLSSLFSSKLVASHFTPVSLWGFFMKKSKVTILERFFTSSRKVQLVYWNRTQMREKWADHRPMMSPVSQLSVILMNPNREACPVTPAKDRDLMTAIHPTLGPSRTLNCWGLGHLTWMPMVTKNSTNNLTLVNRDIPNNCHNLKLP